MFLAIKYLVQINRGSKYEMSGKFVIDMVV